MKSQIFIKIFSILPKNLLSALFGNFCRIKFTPYIATMIHHFMIKLLKIDLQEAEKPFHEYKTFEEIFVRRLKKGSRPLANAHLIVPCDGFLSYSRPIKGGETAIQAKGLNYSAKELIYGKSTTIVNQAASLNHENQQNFSLDSSTQPQLDSASLTTPLAWYTTIYLAPFNYHRVHSPAKGKLKALRYIPGELWPVNDICVKAVPKLFCQNERLVFDMELEGGGNFWVIMVGAFNVGRMEPSVYNKLQLNSLKRADHVCIAEEKFIPPTPLNMGDEIGVFSLGSTVILVFDELSVKTFNPPSFEGKHPVRLGWDFKDIIK